MGHLGPENVSVWRGESESAGKSMDGVWLWITLRKFKGNEQSEDSAGLLLELRDDKEVINKSAGKSRKVVGFCYFLDRMTFRASLMPLTCYEITRRIFDERNSQFRSNPS